jgi:LysR family transcriptional regulator, glycine cleavage system transcriptional activator
LDWHDLPPLASLRAFAALAETGSVTAAGAALNVSHAAVSQQVRALEARLGITLVTRDGRRAGLTADGARLAATLTPAFATIGRAVEELTGADAARPLQITTTPALAASWLLPRLAAFRLARPEIELMLHPTAHLVDLAPGGVDLAIRFGDGDWPGLDCEPLISTSYVIVAARSLVGDRRIASPSDILDLPWLQELGTTEITDWLRSRGVLARKSGDIAHMPGHLVTEALRRGEGVTATTRILIEPDLAEGRLVVLFEEDRPKTGYWLVTRPGPMRPPLKAFAAWLRREARRDRSSSP